MKRIAALEKKSDLAFLNYDKFERMLSNIK